MHEDSRSTRQITRDLHYNYYYFDCEFNLWRLGRTKIIDDRFVQKCAKQIKRRIYVSCWTHMSCIFAQKKINMITAKGMCPEISNQHALMIAVSLET